MNRHKAGFPVCKRLEEFDYYYQSTITKRQINQLLKFDLIIIDELGYLPMNKQDMYNMFQFINAMYEYRSLIITTNKEFTDWGEFFFDDNIAVSIVDRIIHYSHIFMLGGESYRLRSKLGH